MPAAMHAGRPPCMVLAAIATMGRHCPPGPLDCMTDVASEMWQRAGILHADDIGSCRGRVYHPQQCGQQESDTPLARSSLKAVLEGKEDSPAGCQSLRNLF